MRDCELSNVTLGGYARALLTTALSLPAMIIIIPILVINEICFVKLFCQLNCTDILLQAFCFQGVGSSISSSSGLCPSTPIRPHDLRHSRVTRIMSKLQILSPISDKSQEQTSSPSSSPQEVETEQKLTSEVWPVDEWHASRAKKRNLNLNLSNSATLAEAGEQNLSFKSLRTPDIQQLLNVPWDVPKLKKKLQNRNFCFRGQPSSPELSPKRCLEYMKRSSQEIILLVPDLSTQRVQTWRLC